MGPEDRQHLTEQQLAKLWTAHRELATVIWGDDKQRDNGLRSRIIELEAAHEDAGEKLGELTEQVKQAKASMIHYIEVERVKDCLGIKALEAHIEACKEQEREDTDVS